MRQTSRWIGVAGLYVLIGLTGLVTLTACGGTQTPRAPVTPTATGSAPTPDPEITTPGPDGSSRPPGLTPPALVPLTVTRTGGIAGVRQTVRVATDGSWTYQDGRSGMSESGRLAAAQRQELARLLRDPALLREARRSSPPGVCSDGFVYTLNIGEMVLRYDDDCGTAGDRPVTKAALTLLMDATAL